MAEAEMRTARRDVLSTVSSVLHPAHVTQGVG